MGADRRRYERVTPAPHQPVEVQIMGTDFLEVLRAVDVSVGGVAIRVNHQFLGYDISDRVELVIKLPGSPAFTAYGFIRHKGANSALFGVELDNLSAVARARLEAFVSRRLAESTGQIPQYARAR